MKIYTTTLSFVVWALAGCSPQAPVDPPPIQEVENGLYHPVMIQGDETWTIEERMAHYGVPGLSIAVIKDFEVHWAKSYGVKNKEDQEPVSATTLFQAGSISKPVAAYGALKSVEEGKVKLDNNINDYLSSWQVPDNKFTAQEKVTLKHLLSHTGGLTVHGFLGYTIYEEVPSLIQVLDGKSPANSAKIRVNKLPGESFRYSGGGYCIFQQMLVDQYNQSFPALMQEKVLGPLGMSHSTYAQPLPPERLEEAATGYVPNGDMTKGQRHTYPEMAAAGLWTTAEDLAKFAIDLQLSVKGKSNAVLSQGMAGKMLTPYVEEFIGLGIFIDDKDGEIYFQHGGWDEGFSSQLYAHKEKGYGVVVLTNSNHPAFINELVRAVARTYEWPNFLPPAYEKQEVSPRELSRVRGRYKFGDDRLAQVYEKEGKLYYHYSGSAPLELIKIGNNQYVRRERESQISFLKNPEGDRLHLVFTGQKGEDKIVYEHPQMEEGEILPSEHLMDGQFEKALAAYRQLKKSNPNSSAIQEGTLNSFGYMLMGNGDLKRAIDIFKINTLLYPKAYNTYDSLGEAYMENGDTQLAIQHYKKSLALNPDNSNATKMLEKLQGS